MTPARRAADFLAEVLERLGVGCMSAELYERCRAEVRHQQAAAALEHLALRAEHEQAAAVAELLDWEGVRVGSPSETPAQRLRRLLCQ